VTFLHKSARLVAIASSYVLIGLTSRFLCKLRIFVTFLHKSARLVAIASSYVLIGLTSGFLCKLRIFVTFLHKSARLVAIASSYVLIGLTSGFLCKLRIFVTFLHKSAALLGWNWVLTWLCGLKPLSRPRNLSFTPGKVSFFDELINVLSFSPLGVNSAVTSCETPNCSIITLSSRLTCKNVISTGSAKSKTDRGCSSHSARQAFNR